MSLPHNDLVLNLALRALGENPGVSTPRRSGSRDALDPARASSDVTDCSARSYENVGLNHHRAAPTQPASSCQSQQMQQQQLQLLLQQRLQQHAELASAVAESPQPQQQQFGSPAPNAALVSSLLRQLASTYAASTPTAATAAAPPATAAANVDFRLACQTAAPPAGFVSLATTGANRGATSAADVATNSKNAAVPDSNQAAVLFQMARLVAASPGSRFLAQIFNATEGGVSLFPSSSARPAFGSDAPPFTAPNDAPPYTTVYPPPAFVPPQATSAATWRNLRNSPAAEGPRDGLRGLNIAAGTLAAAAATGSPQALAVGGTGASGEAMSTERASLKRKSWESTDCEERRLPNATFPNSGAAGKNFGALFSPPAGFTRGVFSPEGDGEFRLSGSSGEEGEGKESGGAFMEGQGEWENGEADGEGEGDGEGGAEVNGNKKKMRLTREQLSMLEDFFKKHPHLTPRQKAGLAKSLGVRVRQVEVWFQNRRARTKVKQTEAELEGLRRRCQLLAEENKRLKLQLAARETGEEDVRRKEMVGTSKSIDGEASASCIKAFDRKGTKCSSCHVDMGVEERDAPIEDAEIPFIRFL
ncbi:unnamed protein product [Closterium sp. NIES-53]